MGISVLGPLEVDGQPGFPPRDRVVLQALVIHDRAAVAADVLADALWGENPPTSWAKIVQGSVWRLRRALGHSAIETTTAGYRLSVGDDEIDLRQFQELVAQGRSLAAAGQPARAAARFAKALALWRGDPLPDLERWPAGRHVAVRLEELRRSVQEDHVAALLDAGEDVVPAASALVSADPLREARWALLARALYRTGRQSEALAALRTARKTLQEELALDPGEELIDLEQAILTHDPGLRSATRGPAPSVHCPYKGLLVYEQVDAPLFFGRSREVERCLRELRHRGLLVLAGPSGSGKSSLARAGVGTALVSAGRRVLVTTPGTDPESSLLVAVSTPLTTVLVVDQIEELLTGGHPDPVVHTVLDRLDQEERAGRDIVLVVRADQIGALAVTPSMARRVEKALHLLPPMARDGLRAAIEGPAEHAGLVLEPGLVELLLREVENEPGALPLLSHALAETWERREGNTLTVDGYRATGGIRGAVAQSAESLYQSLPPGRRAAMRAVTMRLVAVSPDGEPVITRVPIASVSSDPEHRATLDLLRKARLVTSDDTTATLAHEAVVRAWPRLRTWLDEDAAGHGILRHLSQAAEDWVRRGRPDSELYRGPRLEAALEWRSTTRPALTEDEAGFLDAAERLREEEQEDAQARLRHRVRQARRLRVALAGTAAGLALAVAAGGLAVTQQREAADTAARADAERLVAQSVSLRDSRRDLAALLAVEAHRMMPGALTGDALLGLFTSAPGFAGYRATEVPLTTGQVLPDGQTVLAVGTDGVVRVVDARSGRTTVRFPSPPDGVRNARVAVSTDATTAAAISWEGSDRGGGSAWLSVYDVQAGARLHDDVLLPMDPGAVAVGPDGRFVAVSGYEDGRVLVFDTTDGIPDLSTVDDVAAGVRSLPTVGSAPWPYDGQRRTAGLAFTSDGTLAVGSEVGVVRLVDPVTGSARRLSGGPDLSSNNLVAVSADPDVLVTAGTDALVRWDLSSGRPRWTSPLPEPSCQALLVLVETDAVLCGGFDRVVALDLQSGAPTPSSYDMQGGTVSDLLLSPDRRTLVQLSSTQPLIARWRLDGIGPLARLLDTRGSPAGYNADGSMLLIVGPVTGLSTLGEPLRDWRAVDPRDGTTLARQRPDEHDPTWTGRRDMLLVWGATGTGRVIDVRTHRERLRLDGGVGARPTIVSISADGRRVIAWSVEDGVHGTWELWDLDTGAPLSAGIVFSQRAVSLGRNGRYVMWSDGETVSTSDPAIRRRVATRSDVVHAGASGSGLVAASYTDGTLGFLRERDLTPLGPSLSQPVGRVRQFSFSADGTMVAAHSGDGGVRLIDVASRLQLGEPWDVGQRTGSVALRPDGKELALPHPHGVALWDLRTSSAVREACRLAGRTLTPAEVRSYLDGRTPAGCR